MLVWLFPLAAGIGLGWIAHHYFVSRYLIWTIRDMRKDHFVYDPPRDASVQRPQLVRRNET